MRIFNALLLAATVTAAAGCNNNGTTDGGTDSGPASDGGADTGVMPSADGGVPSSFFPAPGPVFTMTDNAAGTVQVSASGEALAEMGYDYTSMPSDATAIFVDGWAIRYDHFYVIVKTVRLNMPGSDTTMRQNVGPVVAHHDGPFALDLHQHGVLSGAGGPPETAVPMFIFNGPDSGGTFDTTMRYAFSFETTAATATMQNVNVLAASEADINTMIAHGWSEYVVGTATYMGRTATMAVDPTFQSPPFPTTVKFQLGMGIPAAYINCHNPELGDVDMPSTRGIQPSATGATRAQVTIHTDHTFWDELEVEGTFYHFDPFAARAQMVGGVFTVTMNDLMGTTPTALTDLMSHPVLNRADQTTGYDVTMDHPPPTYDLNGVPATTVPDFRSYVAYTTRSQGHLNSDGLCFVMPTGDFAF